MGKNPAFQFYPSDWSRDLQEHPLEIEGAWIRICCRLWWSDTPGTLEKPLRFWSDLLRIHGNKTLGIVRHLGRERIADIVEDNGLIRITSRRMVHDEIIRDIRRKAGLLGGNPALVLNKQEVKQTVNQNPTPSSSASTSSSPSSIKEIEKPSITPLTRTDKLTQDELQEITRLAFKIERHYQQKFNITLWIQNNIGMNPQTHLHVLRRICAEGDKDKWPDFPKAYADKIASVEEGNYNERDHTAQAKINKNVFSDLLNDLKKMKG